MARGAKKSVRVQSRLERFEAIVKYADSLEIPEDAQKLDVVAVTRARGLGRLMRKHVGGGDDRLDEHSTLGKMLVEFEAAALEVLDAIEDARHYGRDDEAVLYVAALVIHQQSLLVVRELGVPDLSAARAFFTDEIE